MNIKNVLKVVVISCLAGMMALASFGCKEEEVIENKLANQYENITYYFRQGFKRDGKQLVILTESTVFLRRI